MSDETRLTRHERRDTLVIKSHLGEARFALTRVCARHAKFSTLEADRSAKLRGEGGATTARLRAPRLKVELAPRGGAALDAGPGASSAPGVHIVELGKALHFCNERSEERSSEATTS